MKPKIQITLERAKELLRYVPETGEFFWRVDRVHKGKAGQKVGTKHPTGYTVIAIDGIQHKAHRLAWLIEHGEHAPSCIDHINGDRADNRISNLRVTDHAGNSQNQRCAHSRSNSGLLGVSWKKDKSKWRASIDVSGRKMHLGYFADQNAAQNAYLAAKRQFHQTATI